MTARVYFLDVGQGDGTVVVVESLDKPKQAIIIDCAYAPTAIEALEDEGVEAIPLIVITHGDRDHCDGLIPLVNRYFGKIGTIAINYDKARQLITKDSVYRSLISSLLDAYDEGAFGALAPASSVEGCDWPWEATLPVELEVLYPQQNDLGRALLDEDANLASCIVRMSHRDVRFILGADLPSKGWLQLRDRGVDLSAEVLRFPHHGGSLFGEMQLEELLQLVTPTVVVFSVGTPNPHGHPTAEVMATVRSIGARIVCTQVTPRCHDQIAADREGIIATFPPTMKIGRSSSFASQCPCAGSIRVEIDDEGWRVLPEAKVHSSVIGKFATPLCRTAT